MFYSVYLTNVENAEQAKKGSNKSSHSFTSALAWFMTVMMRSFSAIRIPT